MQPDIGEIWGAAGILVGFQVTAFSLRVNREISRGDASDLTWLPPADLLNLLSLLVTMLAVFVAPILRLVSEETAERALGLAVLLVVGYAFALAGHYEMFDPRTSRSFRAFPFQEKVAVFSVVVVSAVYVGVAMAR